MERTASLTRCGKMSAWEFCEDAGDGTWYPLMDLDCAVIESALASSTPAVDLTVVGIPMELTLRTLRLEHKYVDWDGMGRGAGLESSRGGAGAPLRVYVDCAQDRGTFRDYSSRHCISR